jgi:hypothetical protein
VRADSLRTRIATRYSQVAPMFTAGSSHLAPLL